MELGIWACYFAMETLAVLYSDNNCPCFNPVSPAGQSQPMAGAGTGNPCSLHLPCPLRGPFTSWVQGWQSWITPPHLLQLITCRFVKLFSKTHESPTHIGSASLSHTMLNKLLTHNITKNLIRGLYGVFDVTVFVW